MDKIMNSLGGKSPTSEERYKKALVKASIGGAGLVCHTDRQTREPFLKGKSQYG